MSVRIRLRRMGAKKQPFYRVVVADSRSPRDGRFLDTIGTYDPRTEPAAIRIDREKALRWLNEGADPTDSAKSLLSKAGVWQEFRTGVAPEPREEAPKAAGRPTPAAPAERTAPEPEVEPAPEPATEIEREGEPEAGAAAEERAVAEGDVKGAAEEPAGAAEPEAVAEAAEDEAAEEEAAEEAAGPEEK